MKVTLFYSAKSENEFIFKELLENANKTFGLKVVYTVSINGKEIDKSLIKTHIREITKPVFYISGPQGVVETYRERLEKMGVKQIKTDLFSGYE